MAVGEVAALMAVGEVAVIRANLYRQRCNRCEELILTFGSQHDYRTFGMCTCLFD